MRATELQLFVGTRRPDRTRMEKVQNRPYFPKPYGGLWTSTYDPYFGSEWIEWCKINEYDWGECGEFPCWLLQPVETANVLLIDSYEDLESAARYYRLEHDPKMGLMTLLDFEQMALDFDGMRLTSKGQQETHLSHPESLYGFDCESTVWFRFVFEDVKGMGRQRFERVRMEP